jgi:hypothetical protein
VRLLVSSHIFFAAPWRLFEVACLLFGRREKAALRILVDRDCGWNYILRACFTRGIFFAVSLTFPLTSAYPR